MSTTALTQVSDEIAKLESRVQQLEVESKIDPTLQAKLSVAIVEFVTFCNNLRERGICPTQAKLGQFTSVCSSGCCNVLNL